MTAGEERGRCGESGIVLTGMQECDCDKVGKFRDGNARTNAWVSFEGFLIILVALCLIETCSHPRRRLPRFSLLHRVYALEGTPYISAQPASPARAQWSTVPEGLAPPPSPPHSLLWSEWSTPKHVATMARCQPTTRATALQVLAEAIAINSCVATLSNFLQTDLSSRRQLQAIRRQAARNNVHLAGQDRLATSPLLRRRARQQRPTRRMSFSMLAHTCGQKATRRAMFR